MPDPRTSTIDEFYGMVRDKNGIEIDKREFYSLINTINRGTSDIRKRDGSRKWDSETHAAGSSTKTYGLFTFTDDAGTDLYIKITQDGKIYKHAGAGNDWTEITTGAPGGGLAAADAFFAQLSTVDTGAGASASGTLEASDSTTITDNDAAYTVNAHVGRILQVATGEKKLIGINTATKIFAKERFDTVPTGAFNVYPRAIEFFFANGTNFYKCDGTTLTRLDNATYSYAFKGIVAHNERLFGWKGTRLHYSDGGVGEQFSGNAWQDFPTTVRVAQPLKEILIVYETRRTSAIFGDSPDNYKVREIIPGVGTVAPKSVATFIHLQFFLSDEYGVCIVSGERLSPNSKLEPISVSDNYLNDHILDHTAAQLAAACAIVHRGKYYIVIDDDWYVLHIEESLLSPRDRDGNIRWIWTMHDYPDAIDPNVLAHFGTSFVGGAQDNGQVYELEVGGVLSDDGTAIAWEIEKRDWQPTTSKSTSHFLQLKVSQPTHASAIAMAYRFDADGSTYGAADKTITLSTASSFEHEIPIPSAISTTKDIGKRISFKITESGSLGTSPIEEIVLLYELNELV
jgi:hypothetical protein